VSTLPTTKTRSWRGPSVSGRKKGTILSPWTPYFSLGHLSTETVVSYSHARLPGGRWSGGGPFKVVRTTVEQTPASAYVKYYNNVNDPSTLTRDGSVLLEGNQAGVTDLQDPKHLTKSEAEALGATAIARTMPTNPAFDLSTFFGELMREGLPNLPTSQIKNEVSLAKASGGEYLNIEFGWLPLVNGVRDFAGTVRHADDILRKYQEESNKRLSRRYDWPLERSYATQNTAFNMTNNMGTFTGGFREQEKTRRVWFEADFVYHIPAGGDITDKFRRYASEARKLYGIDLSPEVLWNLAPWSWAVDWFTNTGDVIHNVSAMGQDGMVMHHAYIMCHTIHKFVDVGFYDGKRYQKTTVKETKERWPATPYGFGVSYGSLSGRQIAILSALGLSRW
jgi:hypothetical protein